MTKKISTILLLLTLTVTAFAQTPKTPESVAKEYFDLVQKKQWNTIASMFSPKALTEFKKAVVPVIQFDLVQRKGDMCEVFFGKRHTPKELQDMDNEDFFFFVMSGLMMQIKGTAPKFTKVETLGTVKENENTVHVVSRLHLEKDGIEKSQIDLSSLEKVNGEWKLLLKDDIERFVIELQSSVMGN